MDQFRDVIHNTTLEPKQKVEFWSGVSHFHSQRIIGHLFHHGAHSVENYYGRTHGVQGYVKLASVLFQCEQMTLVVIEQLGKDASAVIIDVCYSLLLADVCVEKLCQVITNVVLPGHQPVHSIIEVMDVVFPLLKGSHQLTLGVVFELLIVPLDHEAIRIENELLFVRALYLVVLVDGQYFAVIVLVDFLDVVVGVVLVLPGGLSVQNHFHHVVIDVVNVLVSLEITRTNLPSPLMNSTQVIILHFQCEYHVVVEPEKMKMNSSVIVIYELH